MYNHVTAHVKPSTSLQWLLYGIHILLLLIYIAQYESGLYFLPLMAVQACLFYLLYKRRFYFLQPRYWTVLNGRFYLNKDAKQNNVKPAQAMDVNPVAVWPFALLFRYRPASAANIPSSLPWQWEIICKDALASSSFHPLAAVLNTAHTQGTDKPQ